MVTDSSGVSRAENQRELIPPRDRLEYVADHLAEMKTLVQSMGYSTLEGLLALSEAEARRAAVETGHKGTQRF